MLELAAPLWRQCGWRQYIIATGERLGSFATKLTEQGFYVAHCPVSSQRQWLNQYWSLLCDIAPDVVHQHTEHLNLIKATTAIFAKARVFRTVHNVFRYDGSLRIKKLIERRLARLFGVKTITISRSVHDNEVLRLGNDSKLCWNWFDSVYFRPPSVFERAHARQSLDLADNEIALLTVGNSNDAKNYSALIRSLSALQREDLTIKYFMVGEEHPKLAERRVSKQTGVSHIVHFCGPQLDVRKYLWAADIFVMPSIHEGFSIAALEGLATGVSCVYAASPGLSDLKSFPLDIQWTATDADSIGRALREIIGNKHLRKCNTTNSSFVRNYFSVERRATVYSDLWNESLSAKFK
jgi:glycosyltransferase involved in cell wall biosynthesis